MSNTPKYRRRERLARQRARDRLTVRATIERAQLAYEQHERRVDVQLTIRQEVAA